MYARCARAAAPAVGCFSARSRLATSSRCSRDSGQGAQRISQTLLDWALPRFQRRLIRDCCCPACGDGRGFDPGSGLRPSALQRTSHCWHGEACQADFVRAIITISGSGSCLVTAGRIGESCQAAPLKADAARGIRGCKPQALLSNLSRLCRQYRANLMFPVMECRIPGNMVFAYRMDNCGML